MPELADRQCEFGVLLGNGSKLQVGTGPLTRETQQLGQESGAAGVAWVLPNLLVLGGDGLAEIAGLEMFTCAADESLSQFYVG